MCYNIIRYTSKYGYRFWREYRSATLRSIAPRRMSCRVLIYIEKNHQTETDVWFISSLVSEVMKLLAIGLMYRIRQTLKFLYRR